MTDPRPLTEESRDRWFTPVAMRWYLFLLVQGALLRNQAAPWWWIGIVVGVGSFCALLRCATLWERATK